MATISSVELHIPGNSIDKVAPSSGSESQHEDIEMKNRVDASWEQMNNGVSSKILMSLMNEPCSTKWIAYLGLAPKETGSIGQDAAQNGQNFISDDDKKIDAMCEKMQGVPKRTFKSFSTKPSSSVARTSSNDWTKNLAFAQRRTETAGQDIPLENGILLQKRSNVMQESTSNETKRIAAAALSAVKEAAAAAAAAPGRGKVGITEIRDVAGQEIEVKFVEADSKEAPEKSKAPTSAVDAVVEQIKKKPKLSVLDKTKKDWEEF